MTNPTPNCLPIDFAMDWVQYPSVSTQHPRDLPPMTCFSADWETSTDLKIPDGDIMDTDTKQKDAPCEFNWDQFNADPNADATLNLPTLPSVPSDASIEYACKAWATPSLLDLCNVVAHHMAMPLRSFASCYEELQLLQAGFANCVRQSAERLVDGTDIPINQRQKTVERMLRYTLAHWHLLADLIDEYRLAVLSQMIYVQCQFLLIRALRLDQKSLSFERCLLLLLFNTNKNLQSYLVTAHNENEQQATRLQQGGCKHQLLAEVDTCDQCSLVADMAFHGYLHDN